MTQILVYIAVSINPDQECSVFFFVWQQKSMVVWLHSFEENQNSHDP
jgi:hypothetical protein